MLTFEVRIFVSNRWTTESRCYDKDEAIKKANIIAGDRNIDGVKVVQEDYDEDEGIFREKTVFSYFKQDEKVFNPKLNKPKEAPKPVRPPLIKPEPDNRAWLLLFALLVSLGGNVALAMFMGDTGTPDFRIARTGGNLDPAKLIIYDLPTVTMNYGSAEDGKAIKIRLGLELSKRGHVREVERRLSDIISSVASDLSAVGAQDLRQRKGLQKLRKSLRSDVQSAAGSTPIEGVLFKEIVEF